MPETRPAGAGEDAAWVSVPTGLAPQTLIDLTRDPQRLMRVNSLWVFESWEPLGPERCRFRIFNNSNEQAWETEAQVVRLPSGLRLDYADGIKASTLFRVESADPGSVL